MNMIHVHCKRGNLERYIKEIESYLWSHHLEIRTVVNVFVIHSYKFFCVCTGCRFFFLQTYSQCIHRLLQLFQCHISLCRSLA